MYLNFVPILPVPGCAPQENPPVLQPGQVLPAQLTTGADGNPWLQLAGHTYTASGETPTGSGRFWVQVQTVEPNKIQVKLLPSGCKPDFDIKLLFESLGLQPNNETKSVVQQLLRQRLPLSRELIQQFVSSAKDMPAEDRPVFWACRAFLQSLTLKDEPEKVDAALKYLLRRPEGAPEGQKAINQTWPLYPDQEVVRVLTLQTGQNEGEAFIISRYRDQKGQSEDKQLQSLVIRLSTTVWGQVWIQLSIQGRNLTTRVIAEDSSFLSLAQAAEAELKNRFQAIGWELKALTTAKQKIGSIAELVEPRGPENYRSLDTLV